MRSALYVPAHREDLVAKAWRSGADAVVLELEDGVPVADKERARAVVARVLSEPPPVRAEVRVNGRGTGLLVPDLLALAGSTAAAVRLPKTDGPDDVLLVAGLLDELGSDARVLPILETARGVAACAEVVAAHPRVAGLLMGEEDLRADLGCGPEGLRGVRERVVLCARAAGLPAPMQSVWTAVRDLDGLREDCRSGRELGFRGRSVIHPAQIPVVHEMYTPSSEEVTRARALLDHAGQGGSLDTDGVFVDDATVARARRLLTEAGVSPRGSAADARR